MTATPCKFLSQAHVGTSLEASVVACQQYNRAAGRLPIRDVKIIFLYTVDNGQFKKLSTWYCPLHRPASQLSDYDKVV